MIRGREKQYPKEEVEDEPDMSLDLILAEVCDSHANKRAMAVEALLSYFSSLDASSMEILLEFKRTAASSLCNGLRRSRSDEEGITLLKCLTCLIVLIGNDFEELFLEIKAGLLLPIISSNDKSDDIRYQAILVLCLSCTINATEQESINEVLDMCKEIVTRRSGQAADTWYRHCTPQLQTCACDGATLISYNHYRRQADFLTKAEMLRLITADTTDQKLVDRLIIALAHKGPLGDDVDDVLKARPDVRQALSLSESFTYQGNVIELSTTQLNHFHTILLHLTSASLPILMSKSAYIKSKYNLPDVENFDRVRISKKSDEGKRRTEERGKDRRRKMNTHMEADDDDNA